VRTRTARPFHYMPEALGLASVIGQLALVGFCVVFVLPRVIQGVHDEAVALPVMVSRPLDAIIWLARMWWAPLLAAVAAIAWRLHRASPESRPRVLRLSLGVLQIAATVLLAATIWTTVVSLVLVL
jgi:multisubunit Na+/H+ antiporter MnhE subunit